MPLLPLPPSNTARVWLDYNGVIKSHTLQVRHGPGLSAAAAADKGRQFCDGLESFLATGWAFTGARAAAQGSDVSLPIATPAQPTPAGGALATNNEPKEHRFVGRDLITGRRCTVSVYGLNIVVDGDYRLEIPASGPLRDAYNVLMTPTDDNAAFSDTNPECAAVIAYASKPGGSDTRPTFRKPLHIYDLWHTTSPSLFDGDAWHDQLVFAGVAQDMDSSD